MAERRAERAAEEARGRGAGEAVAVFLHPGRGLAPLPRCHQPTAVCGQEPGLPQSLPNQTSNP